ncbi:homeobox protein SEBOX [Talpa occidentalis]|uniref:homeobox protein SEBOX n=1 Tax=Talpa occidentalis TaxID=50954 RepID=UPI00188F022B|nr:homeobox protein SEBOX [Talpa occidentalis]
MAFWLLTLCHTSGLSPHWRKQVPFSSRKLLELEGVFAAWSYPDTGTCEHLAQVTCLPQAKTQVTFDGPPLQERMLEPDFFPYQPDTLQHSWEPWTVGQSPPSHSPAQYTCVQTSCPALSLGPGQGWEGAKAAAPQGLAGSSGLSPEQATPQTSLGSLSDLIYVLATVTNLDYSHPLFPQEVPSDEGN